MKQCPQCSASCEDNDIVCKNCGYLFSAYGDDQGPQAPAPQRPGPGPADHDAESPKGPSGEQQPGGEGSGFHSQPDSRTYSEGAPTPPPYPPQYPPQYPYQKTDGFSVAGLVLGIVSIVLSCCAVGFLPAIPGIVFSILSIQRINHSQGFKKGSGMAITGLVLSIIALLISIYMIVSVAANWGDFSQFYQRFYNEYIRQYEQYKQEYGNSASFIFR